MTIKEIYKKIIELDNLAPSTEVNALFSELVVKAIDQNNKESLTLDERNNLQRICSLSEYEMEKYWAKKIISSINPKTEILKFPYFQNYIDLTRLELFSLNSCTEHQNHRVLFIGGGPLPLTSIVLALKHGIGSIVLDIDEDAVTLSSRLITLIGLEDLITVVKSAGADFQNYNDFNVIYIAALAGTSVSQKNNIFAKIKNQAPQNAHLIARSSWGNRKLLYKPISKSIYKKFKPILEVHPHNEIVNSVIILRNEN